MKRFAALLCLIVALNASEAIAQAVAVSPQQLGSSFDCRRDNGTIPRLVCTDDELRLLDIEQLRLYYTLRHALPQAQQDLRTAYVGAIENIKTQCAAANTQTRACLISGLNALRQHWLSIIQGASSPAASEEAGLDIRQVIEAQTRLRERGLLPPNGISDGLLGTSSRTAISRLQAESGQQSSGFLSADTARLLNVSATNAQRSSTPNNQIVNQSTSATPSQNTTSTRSSAPIDSATQEQLAHAQRALDAQDYEAASRIYRPLAERGIPAAQGGMARLLINNWIHRERSVTERQSAAVEWALLGASRNDPVSQHILGYVASGQTGVAAGGVRTDERDAFRWYLMAAEQGLARAQVAVGLAYLDGRGVAKDEIAAVRWFTRAADQQDAWGENNLGVMYESGRGVQQDYAAAFQWFQRAAAKGNETAQVAVGSAYIEGRGVARNLSEARRILQPIAARATDGYNTQTVRRAQDLLNQIRQVEEAPILNAYQQRQKTLLEQVLNYTTTADENGQLAEYGAVFWISGVNGAHKCILTAFSSSRASGVQQYDVLDIRQFNQAGFRIQGPNTNQYGNRSYTLGDEVKRIQGSGNAVMERLRNAWGLAFQECPGRRSAF